MVESTYYKKGLFKYQILFGMECSFADDFVCVETQTTNFDILTKFIAITDLFSGFFRTY